MDNSESRPATDWRERCNDALDSSLAMQFESTGCDSSASVKTRHTRSRHSRPRQE